MPLSSADQAFLKTFYNRLDPKEPLNPGDPRYVSLDADRPDEKAPRGQRLVPLLYNTIAMSNGFTAQLYSGFPGSGKTTELNCLKRKLTESGYVVLKSDAEDYLNLSEPIEITDALIAVAGAFGEETNRETGTDLMQESVWTRIAALLQTKVEFTEIDLTYAKASLRGDPTFKQTLRTAFAGSLARLASAVHGFIGECVTRLKAHFKNPPGIVFILDSLEKLEGPEAVYRSVGTVFAGQAEKLRLPHCHVVYSIPPYLGVLNPEVKSLYSGPIRMLPMTKLHTREKPEEPCTDGVQAMIQVIEQRGEWRKLLGDDQAVLERIVTASGGYLRDLIRSVREVILQAQALETLPVPPSVVDAVLNVLARDYRRLARDDAEWLAEVAKTRESCLPAMKDLGRLAALLRTHLVLCYQNGEEWYDVHPLARDEIFRLVASRQPQAS